MIVGFIKLARNIPCSVHINGEIPVTIPNTAVKPVRVEGSY